MLVFDWTIRIGGSFSQEELIHVCTVSGQNEQEKNMEVAFNKTYTPRHLEGLSHGLRILKRLAQIFQFRCL